MILFRSSIQVIILIIPAFSVPAFSNPTLSNSAFSTVHSSVPQYTNEKLNKRTGGQTRTDMIKTLQKNAELFEGDIIMDDRLRRAVWGRNLRRDSQNPRMYTWPNGVMYYSVDKRLSDVSKTMLGKAMRQFETRTCIRFKKRIREKDFVVFSASETGVCSSYVGRIGGPQPINIGTACLKLGSFEHEIMHALGFIHEHSREDRDEYIDILHRNILERYFNDFKKYKVADKNGEFDFASVMMYRNNAFSKNGRPTIEAIGDSALEFGQRKSFSVGDVKEINRLYECTSSLRDPIFAGLVESYHGPPNRKFILGKRRLFLKRNNFRT